MLVATSIPGSAVPRVVVFPGEDKAIHAALYGVLAALCLRASRPMEGGPRPMVILAAVLTFAAGDEWHQRYVAGRSADSLDWVADAAGATAATLILTRARLRRETES